jgi:ABC-2 type transport system permease protein
MSFAALWKRNISAGRLAILSHLEYRVDFLVDTIIQPALSTGGELALWSVILSSAGLSSMNGYSKASYLTYVLWALFVARVTANWYYEMEMGTEIETGKINSILVRPISFYEYYFSQFIGYKLSTIAFSFACPALVTLFFPTTVQWLRFPPMLALVLYYLLFAYTLSFCISCLAFHVTRIRGITALKNMTLWLFTGELFPLDLIPDPYKSWIIHLPFAAGVYVPVGFLTGRVGWPEYQQALVSITIGTVVLAALATVLWKNGLRTYAGTGA